MTDQEERAYCERVAKEFDWHGDGGPSAELANLLIEQRAAVRAEYEAQLKTLTAKRDALARGYDEIMDAYNAQVLASRKMEAERDAARKQRALDADAKEDYLKLWLGASRGFSALRTAAQELSDSQLACDSEAEKPKNQMRSSAPLVRYIRALEALRAALAKTPAENPYAGLIAAALPFAGDAFEPHDDVCAEWKQDLATELNKLGEL